MTNHSSLYSGEHQRRAERPNTANKGERNEVTGHHYYRNSSNNAKNMEKPRTTETKYYTSVLTGKTNTNSSYHEEDERMKKKSSLKEMLKNKKSLLSYKGTPMTTEPKNSLMKKVGKDYDYCASAKENKNFFSKAS